MGQSMVNSRSVPQQTAQIFSPLAGQNRTALRFSQMGQSTGSRIRWGRTKDKNERGDCGFVQGARRLFRSNARYSDVLRPKAHADEARGNPAEYRKVAE